MFYFTYGHNMNHDIMRMLLPTAKFLRPAVLMGYSLFLEGYSTRFNGAVVNVDYSMDDEVWGGLYEIPAQDITLVDLDEGSPKYFKRLMLAVGDADAKLRVEACVYRREPQATGMPSRRYLQALLKGTLDCHLPKDYVQRTFGHYMKACGL